MAIRALPVIQDLQRPQTVGDCRGGPRPCGYVSCRYNLLLDCLDNGDLVINAPSSRLHGAERAIPNKHEADREWFVEVRLPAIESEKLNAAAHGRAAIREVAALAKAQDRGSAILSRASQRSAAVIEAARQRGQALKAARTPGARKRRRERVAAIMRRARDRAAKIRETTRQRAQAETARILGAARDDRGPVRIYAIGPLDSASRAHEVAAAWEAEHGEGTTAVHRMLPPTYQRTGAQDKDIDAKFLDEMEDAVDYWFDEPDPNMPSCLLDEIAKLDRSSEDCLLDGIAKLMFVSRERIRQVEEIAMRKVEAAGATLGVEREVERG